LGFGATGACLTTGAGGRAFFAPGGKNGLSWLNKKPGKNNTDRKQAIVEFMKT